MSSERVGHIKIELVKNGVRSSKIYGKSTITVGRMDQSDLQIDDPSMSREHLKIELKDKKLFVTDLGSSNGSLLNHSRLNANKATVIPEGAIVRPGSAKIKLTITLVEVRDLDDVDAELEDLTTALEGLAKSGVKKVREIRLHEETLEKSVRAKQEKLVQLVDRLEAQSLKKEEIEIGLKDLQPKLARVMALMKLQEPRLRKIWVLRKKQIRLFQNRREILLALGDKIDDLEINIENHGLSEKRDRLREEIVRLTDSLESLRRTEEKTRSDVEGQLKLLDMRKQTEQAELQLIKARIQKEIEEVDGKKSITTSKLLELQRELTGTTKQLEDVRDHLAAEVAATEKIENERNSIEVHIEELEGARNAHERNINELHAEETDLDSRVTVKRAEVKELEDFIVNRLAETDERCRQMEKESQDTLDQQLFEAARVAKEQLEQELSFKRETVSVDLARREKEISDRVKALESTLQEQSNSFEERMTIEEKRRKNELELQLKEMQIRHEVVIQEKEKESMTRQSKRIEKQLRALAASSLTTAALYIKSTTPNAASLLSSPELEDEVFQSLKEAVLPQKDGKPVLARAIDLSDRERRFWTRTGVAAFATLTIIGTLVINPSWPGQVLSGMVSYVRNQENSSDYFTRKLEEEKANRPKFLPEQNRIYKESYTDNLLYTECFLLVKTDEEIRKQWTLKLNDYLIKEFEVDEDVVVKFLPVESRLVNDLAESMKTISPNFVDDGVQKMRQMELSYKIEIESILGSSENFQKFWAFQGEFYNETIQSLGSRAPAGN